MIDQMLHHDRFHHKLDLQPTDIRVSFNPSSKRDIIRDLGMIDNRVEWLIDGRKAERLRFFLVANEDGTECQTYFWNGYLATHQIMAPVLDLTINQSDSGFVDVETYEWKLYDTDSNGYFYPQHVTAWISRIIG